MPDLSQIPESMWREAQRRSLVVRPLLAYPQCSRLLAQKAACGDGPGAMIGDSPAMRRLRQLIQEVGGSDVTVLIQGESGCGKELVAQALHAASTRRDERFVAFTISIKPRAGASSRQRDRMQPAPYAPRSNPR